MNDVREEVYRLVWDENAAHKSILALMERNGIRLANSHAFCLVDAATAKEKMAVTVSMYRETVSKNFMARFQRWSRDYLDGHTFKTTCRGGLVIVNITAPAPHAYLSSAKFTDLQKAPKITPNGEIRARLRRALER